VGSPNSGKTSLFNTLTGSRQKVANYAGVTVEHKEGTVKATNGVYFRILDLPGVYGAHPHSQDEEVTWSVLKGAMRGQDLPDGIIIVADATRLEGAISLALDVKHTNIPTILALNKMDVAKQRGLKLDLDTLSQEIGMPVVSAVAIEEDGVRELKAMLMGFLQGWGCNKKHASCSHCPVATGHGSSLAYVRETRQKAKEILEKALQEKAKPSAHTRKADGVLLHPIAGPLILFALLFFVFQAVFIWAEAPMNLIDDGVSWFKDFAQSNMAEGAWRNFLTEGIITSIGSVIIFLPQILILYAFILVLEDSGYLARAAFLLDWLMGCIGLPGRAIVPLLSSFACTVPGILAARTIENKRDRLVTILIAPLMTCSARLPVYALLISAFVPQQTALGVFSLQGLVMFGLYVAGIVGGALVAFVLKMTVLKGETAPLLMEMPNYQYPRLRNLALGLFERAWLFLARAGTIIFFLSILIWFFASWPAPPESATGTAIQYSLAGRIGHFLEPIFTPLGFDWAIVVSLIPAMLAREVFISSLATVYAVSAHTSGTLGATLQSVWDLPMALSVLAWFVFAPQCVAMLAVLRRETGSSKLTAAATLGYFAIAWLAAFATFHGAKLIVG
jgi:ferrous iron transport protein B